MIQATQLNGIIRNEIAELGKCGRYPLCGPFVELDILRIAGNKVTTLVYLGLQGIDEQVSRLVDYLMGVRQPDTARLSRMKRPEMRPRKLI